MRNAVGGIFLGSFCQPHKYFMEHKYLPKTKHESYPGYGRPHSTVWITGNDPDLRNKYYAYLKHRSQARWRGEDYSLTWEDWHELWTDELWEQRGRGRDSMILTRECFAAGWHKENCTIQPRTVHLARRKEYGQ